MYAGSAAAADMYSVFIGLSSFIVLYTTMKTDKFAQFHAY